MGEVMLFTCLAVYFGRHEIKPSAEPPSQLKIREVVQIQDEDLLQPIKIFV